MKETFPAIINKAKICYSQIENDTGIQLHNIRGIENLLSKVGEEVEEFMTFSREKAQKAQQREWKVAQLK